MTKSVSACVAFAVLLFAALHSISGCSSSDSGPEVVVYTSVDMVDARGVFEDFEKKTGITVKPLYDTEATKTTGLALRLISEKDRPCADVFWNNELSRMLMLAEEGVLAGYESPSGEDIPDEFKGDGGLWTAFAIRARVIVYNTENVAGQDAPASLEDLTGPRWKGKVGIANPLFGTTACHAAALCSTLGEEKALDYFRRLKENGVKVYDGNSVVRDAVANGEILVGLTDTDDVLLGMKRGMKIALVLPDQGEGQVGTLVIPNSVAMVAGAPNPEEARRMVDYLLSKEVEKLFADPSLGQIPVRDRQRIASTHPEFLTIKATEVDWAEVSSLTTSFSKAAADVLLD